MIYNAGEHDSAFNMLQAYPYHSDKPYTEMMLNILRYKVLDAFQDTARSRLYLEQRHLNLIDKYLESEKMHIRFESFVLRDSIQK